MEAIDDFNAGVLGLQGTQILRLRLLGQSAMPGIAGLHRRGKVLDSNDFSRRILRLQKLIAEKRYDTQPLERCIFQPRVVKVISVNVDDCFS